MFLKKKEVAERFGISVSSVNNYMRQGMPYYKIGSKLVRFDIKDIEKWLREKEKYEGN
jgi:predicted DNA-binding transcriptional regulator AlpA